MATVDWGARSRTVALTSAESVSVTVTSGTQTSTGTANRDLTQLQQTAQVVTLGTALPVGTVTVSATFYDQPNETGDVVGTYTNTTTTLQASGTLVSAGQQLAITANPVIRRVVISPPTTVAPNATEQLTFTAYDINNNPLPQVSAGSATFTAAGGQSFISVTSYGLVTGNSAGSQTVTCTHRRGHKLAGYGNRQLITWLWNDPNGPFQSALLEAGFELADRPFDLIEGVVVD